MTDRRVRSAFWLARAELDRLLGSVSCRSWLGLRNRCILELLAWAGLRVSEVVHLRPCDVLWESRRVSVECGKGGKSRTVPVHPESVQLLSVWAARRKPGRYFFTTFSGGAVGVRYVQEMVKRVARAAGLPCADRVTPHVLRHTYATLLLGDRFTLPEVQRLLGHSSLSSTAVYLHVNEVDLSQKVDGRSRGGGVTTTAEIPDGVQG